MKQYRVIFTVLVEADEIDDAATRADEICDIMAENPVVTDAHWDELSAAIGDEE